MSPAPRRPCSDPGGGRPGRFVGWCPGSRAVRLQRLQHHPAERGSLARGAEASGTMQIAGDSSYAVRPGARLTTILLILIHDNLLLRTPTQAPEPPSREVRADGFHPLRRYAVERRQFTGCELSTTFIAVRLFAPWATAAAIDGNPSWD